MQKEAALFKALSDPTRLRLAILLAIRGETCVCELAEALDEPDYKISRHLSLLRSAGIVNVRREGAWMHYRLVEARSDLEKCLQECFRDCLTGHPTVRGDLKRIKKGMCRKPEKCQSPRKSR
ncbi:MAG: metalloregulator ArsR/SmtB family transcription factor [Candidatus Sumerlaeota bacterium]|nr:metalloregulator ArsR/SmtB family transcription factor [Candidatus Sumerlaeota bacterium]